MELKTAVHNFTSACEYLLAKMTIHRPPTGEEVLLVKHYCNEILQKLESPPTHADQVKLSLDR
jgi:hypothetical protein